SYRPRSLLRRSSQVLGKSPPVAATTRTGELSADVTAAAQLTGLQPRPERAIQRHRFRIAAHPVAAATRTGRPATSLPRRSSPGCRRIPSRRATRRRHRAAQLPRCNCNQIGRSYQPTSLRGAATVLSADEAFATLTVVAGAVLGDAAVEA